MADLLDDPSYRQARCPSPIAGSSEARVCFARDGLVGAAGLLRATMFGAEAAQIAAKSIDVL